MKKDYLYLCDVENKNLWRLPYNKEKYLLKISSDWQHLEAGDEELSRLFLYFKENGELVANADNLFVGFIA